MQPTTTGATYSAPPMLAPASASSFYSDNPQALAEYLITNGYDVEPGRSKTEYARLWHKGSLVVVYHSGTALVQGQREPAISLLRGLVASQLDLVGATGGQR